MKKCVELNCDGNVFTILVFSENIINSNELWGDIIDVCSVDESHFKIINTGSPITDTTLIPFWDSETSTIDLNGVSQNIKNKIFKNNKISIEGIGRVKQALDGFDNEYIETQMFWKDHAVIDELPDVFQNDFNITYKN